MSNNTNSASSYPVGHYEITVSRSMGFNPDWSLTEDFIGADVRFVFNNKSTKPCVAVRGEELRVPKVWVKDHTSLDAAFSFARSQLEPVLSRFADYHAQTGKRWELVRKHGCEMELLP